MAFLVTFFDNVYAQSCHTEALELDELAERIKNTKAPHKELLPLLKLALLGGVRSSQGSLRHDANVVKISGIEGDYDGEAVPFDVATQRLDSAGLSFVAYTTPSHTPTTPHWRILCPFAQERGPAERARMVNRLNGVLGGTLNLESWVPSQGFFYGHADGVAFEIAVGDGDEHIDEADELDPGLGPPSRPGGQQQGKRGALDYTALGESDLIDLIKTAAHFFGPAKELVRRWAYAEVAAPDAETQLLAAFDAVPSGQRDRKWSKGRSSVPRWVKQVYARVAKRRVLFLKRLIDRLDADDQWRGAVRLNEFTNAIEVAAPFPPPATGIMPGAVYRALDDPVDVIEALVVIQEDGFPNAGKAVLRDALTAVAARHRYHPVHSWLDSLQWDGKERINRLFLEYFPATLPSEGEQEARDRMVSYFERTAESFMVGAVARVFQPGCKVDCLPVLVGDQGFLKSQGLQALVPDAASFTDDLSTALIDRDTKESLHGKWVIELAEFPHIRREVEKVKAFFSRRVDRFRRAYDRANKDWPRQCAFIATTNELEFIDTTGNRRFWPVPMAGPANVAMIEADHDQLWAEAVHWYRQGSRWWLPPAIEAIAGDIQDLFLETDFWQGLIADWVRDRAPRDQNQSVKPFTTKKILELALGYGLRGDEENRRIAGVAEERRAARCLRRLKFRQDHHQRRVDGERQRFWTDPAGIWVKRTA